MTDPNLKETAKVECPNCDEMIELTRNKNGRVMMSKNGAITGKTLFGEIGKRRGIVGGGNGVNAGSLYGIAGGIILGLGGYIVGDKLLDTPHCPQCGEDINLDL